MRRMRNDRKHIETKFLQSSTCFFKHRTGVTAAKAKGVLQDKLLVYGPLSLGHAIDIDCRARAEVDGRRHDAFSPIPMRRRGIRDNTRIKDELFAPFFFFSQRSIVKEILPLPSRCKNTTWPYYFVTAPNPQEMRYHGK